EDEHDEGADPDGAKRVRIEGLRQHAKTLRPRGRTVADMTDVTLTPSGPPETVLAPEAADALAALHNALAAPEPARRAEVSSVVARWPRFLDAWAQLGELARDEIEAYAYFR